MRAGRVALVAGAGLVGYIAYKVFEVATRPLPCEPVRVVGLPPDIGVPDIPSAPNIPSAEMTEAQRQQFAEDFTAVVQRRLALSKPRRGFQISTDFS